MTDSIHLLACGSCSRQLDVRALEPGTTVRCVCDATLVVGPPKVVNVRGLACGHCGGVVEQGATSCGYCHAELSKNDLHESSLCPACAARIPADSKHCKACGVELRAAALPPLPRDGKCPRCDGALCVHLLPDAEVIECAEGCGGLWCTRETFERLRRTAATSGAVVEAAPAPPRSALPAPGERHYIPCLTCGEMMQRRQFRHMDRPSGIVLDVCKNHGVWFDREELTAALAFVARAGGGGTGLAPADFGGRTPLSGEAAEALGRAMVQPVRSRGSGPAALGGALGEAIGEALSAIFNFSLFD